MHELSIMKEVLAVALENAEQNDAKKIREISLSVGALASIVPDWAQMFFDYISKDTIAENAKIDIETLPAKIKCHSCGTEIEMETHNLLFSCNKCESNNIELISGREFRVVSMEVE